MMSALVIFFNLTVTSNPVDYVILIEADTGMVVYQKNADARLYPASTTKILTTYLGILMGDLDETVVTSERGIME